MTRVEPQLRLTEIFFSLQGETTRSGLPTVFVRLTGCPLRCVYCDTAYAFYGGEQRGISEVLEQVADYGTRYVTVTGGEPLAQKHGRALLVALCDAGYDVSLETSGALDISTVDSRVSRIVDVKTPGSGEEAKNRWENIDHLNARDELKFVLIDQADYDWAKAQVVERKLSQRCTVLFSPVHGMIDPADIGDWVLRDRLDVRLQLQLHKVLWGEVRGR